MQEDTTTYLLETVPGIARRLHKRFPLAETGDIEQSIWEWALERPQIVSDAITVGDGSDSPDKGVRWLYGALSRAGERAARRERAAILGYSTTDEAFYSVGALSDLLTHLFASGVTEEPPRDRDRPIGRVQTSGTSYGDWAVSLMDVRAAFAGLPAGMRNLLYTRLHEWADLTDADAASRMGLTADQLRGRVRWALTRMQRLLGGSTPWRRDETREDDGARSATTG